MRKFIWAFLYQLDKQYNSEMLHLWHDHLRGPAGYKGDIFLMTNLTGINIPDINIIPIERTATSVTEIQIMCVREYDRLPWDEYDIGMYMDMDILALKDITPLFADDDALAVTTSFMSVGHERHAGYFYNPIRGKLQNLLHPVARSRGVNTCCYSIMSKHRHTTMGVWKELIESYPPTALPKYGDQSFLNLAVFKKMLKIKHYPIGMVAHTQWAQHPDAVIWHFPIGEIRLDKMREFSRLTTATHDGVVSEPAV